MFAADTQLFSTRALYIGQVARGQRLAASLRAACVRASFQVWVGVEFGIGFGSRSGLKFGFGFGIGLGFGLSIGIGNGLGDVLGL